MRKKLGALCMTVGAALLIGALALFLWNQKEAARAEQTSMAVISGAGAAGDVPAGLLQTVDRALPLQRNYYGGKSGAGCA